MGMGPAAPAAPRHPAAARTEPRPGLAADLSLPGPGLGHGAAHVAASRKGRLSCRCSPPFPRELESSRLEPESCIDPHCILNPAAAEASGFSARGGGVFLRRRAVSCVGVRWALFLFQ